MIKVRVGKGKFKRKPVTVSTGTKVIEADIKFYIRKEDIVYALIEHLYNDKEIPTTKRKILNITTECLWLNGVDLWVALEHLWEYPECGKEWAPKAESVVNKLFPELT